MRAIQQKRLIRLLSLFKAEFFSSCWWIDLFFGIIWYFWSKGRSTQRTPHVRQVCATGAPWVRLVCAKKWRTPEKIWITEAGCAWKLIINWLESIFNLTRHFAKRVYLSIKTIHIYVQVQVKIPGPKFFFFKIFFSKTYFRSWICIFTGIYEKY